jgi:tRNA threonylcarbamoyladenosine biosynthesis protein TsaB
MKILALDTATEACSAALLQDGEIVSRYQLAPRRHGELILTMLGEVLAEGGYLLKDMDAIAFGRGPGSFTGVRIAVAVTQGIALAAELPVVPVSTLAAMALQVMQTDQAEKVLCALDARMDEVYWAGYEFDANLLVRECIVESVCPPQSVAWPAEVHGWYGVGGGFVRYESMLMENSKAKLVEIYPDVLPHAAAIARLGSEMFRRGEAVTAEQALPVYLRNQVASKPGQ